MGSFGQILIVSEGTEFVSVKQGESPVLVLRNKEGITDVVAMAVNFLRNDCPSVQFFLHEAVIGLGQEYVRDCFSTLQETFTALQLNEVFHASINSRVIIVYAREKR